MLFWAVDNTVGGPISIVFDSRMVVWAARRVHHEGETMTDDAYKNNDFDKTSKLEQLVKAHRDELEAIRTTDSNSTTDAIGPSTEEQLWAAFQSKLLNDRTCEDHERRVKEKNAKDEGPLKMWGPVIIIVLTALVMLLALSSFDKVTGIHSLAMRFKYLAVAAAAFGAVAAGFFLRAHQGSVVVDGLGKMLALSSALLALLATIVLLWLDTMV